MRYGLLWLASFFLLLSRLFSKLTQVVACIGTSFLSVAKKYSIAWIDHVLFVHSSLAGPLMSCFHLWAIMQGAFVFKFLCEHMFLFYLDIYLKVEIMSHMVILCLTYWGKLIWKTKEKTSDLVLDTKVWLVKPSVHGVCLSPIPAPGGTSIKQEDRSDVSQAAPQPQLGWWVGFRRPILVQLWNTVHSHLLSLPVDFNECCFTLWSKWDLNWHQKTIHQVKQTFVSKECLK